MSNISISHVQSFLDSIRMIEKKQLTKREQFAMAAMREYLREYPDTEPESMAATAVKMADAMIKELAK
jgi:metal-responsive CopG/Arc/MetJ family transcriptional regulator